MINMHKIAVMDYESDSVDPYTCQPTQLACLMVEPRTLEIIPGSEFNSLMRPADIDNDNYLQEHKNTIEFHAKNQHSTAEEVVATWKEAPSQKVVWQKFVNYLLQYHTTQSRKSVWTAPIVAGMNIINFDCIINDRLAKLYGNVDKQGRSTLFYARDRLDLMLYCTQWFESSEEPKSYSMDALREYFGIDAEGAHDALKDVKDTSNILIKFQKLIRKTSAKVKFAGAFLTDNNES